MHRQLPPLNALRAFDAVARDGSFGGAARQLGVSQGAVSRHISNLEAFLGCTLFTRGRQGATLTAAGQDYHRATGPALQTILDASMRCRAAAVGFRVLRISTPASFALRWLAPRLRDFQNRHSGIAIELATSDVCPDFSMDRSDAAIVPAPANMASKDWHLLFHETVVPVCSPDFAARSGIGTVHDLAGARLLHTTTRAELWPRWLEGQGVTTASPGESGAGFGFQDFYLSIEAAIAGVGVALVPAFLVTDALRDGVLIQPTGGAFRSGHACWFVARPGRETDPMLAILMEWIRDGIGNGDTA